jgi:hypothetical protein
MFRETVATTTRLVKLFDENSDITPSFLCDDGAMKPSVLARKPKML